MLREGAPHASAAREMSSPLRDTPRGLSGVQHQRPVRTHPLFLATNRNSTRVQCGGKAVLQKHLLCFGGKIPYRFVITISSAIENLVTTQNARGPKPALKPLTPPPFAIYCAKWVGRIAGIAATSSAAPLPVKGYKRLSAQTAIN